MWEQVKSFSPSKMGTKKGMCLQNVRLGFGIPAKYASAKEDMQANKRAGTLHPISSLPTNVAVPVYIDSTSQYEHIIVSDKGTYYSDGVKISKDKYKNYFGWGELCDGVRVVKYVADKPSTGWKIVPQKGTFTSSVNGLRVRRSPSLNGQVVATYDKGGSVKYDGYVDNEGYRWITYIGKSGNRNYIARRKLDNSKIFGTCK